MFKKLFIGLISIALCQASSAQKQSKSAVKPTQSKAKKTTAKTSKPLAAKLNQDTKTIVKATSNASKSTAMTADKEKSLPTEQSKLPENPTNKKSSDSDVAAQTGQTQGNDKTQLTSTEKTSPENRSRIIKKQAQEEFDASAIYANGLKVSTNKFGDDFAQYIAQYVENYHNNFGSRMARIKNSNRKYFSLIENIMRKHGIPKEFKSLCVIESGLNPNAVSPVGAVGPWQFMEPTAKNMGLRVDEELDERRDFYKSTIAAAKFCKRLHGIFDDWLLVVASYNCGPAPVLRALNNTGAKSFWEIKKYLPKETQNHVMAFIATSAYYDKNTKVLDMGKYPAVKKNVNIKNNVPLAKGNSKDKNPNIANNDKQEDLPVPAPDPNDPQMTEEEMKQIVGIKIKGAYNIESIADALEIDLGKMRRWNPGFNEKALASAEPFKLLVPSDKVENFIIEKESILKKSIKNPRTVSVPGPKIANAVNLRAKLAERERKKAEETKNTSITQAQPEKVNTPTTYTIQTSAKSNKTESSVAKDKKYVVKQGDNLNQIAEQFGMTVSRLMSINNLKTDNIKVGHTLYLE